jgi:hypothetical protein
VGLSEREAWDVLAKAWATAEPDECGDYYAKFGRSPEWCAYGLCKSIKILWARGKISDQIAQQMTRRIISRYPQAASPRLVWPPSASGARARAKFCREMAKEVARADQDSRLTADQ